MKKLLEQSKSLTREIDAVKATLAVHGKGVEFLILDDQSVVKLGKKSVEWKPKLPRGVKIV